MIMLAAIVQLKENSWPGMQHNIGRSLPYSMSVSFDLIMLRLNKMLQS